MGSFTVEHKDAVVIVGEYDEKENEIGIEDVVNSKTGEVLTDDWFENGDIYDPALTRKIKDRGNDQVINDFLDQL